MATSKIDQAQSFADQLSEILGDNLLSLMVFGAEVRPGYSLGHTELSLLIIVKDASTAALRPIEAAIATWAKRRGPPPLIFTEREWQDSTDVFPIEIEDMREAHRRLKGADPFEGLTTNQEDLRRELERELRGKLLQLRAQYAAAAPDGKALTRLLIDSVSTFFVLMRGLVRLVGGTPQAKPADLVAQACGAAQLDADAFDWVVRKVSGQTVHALKAYDPAGARYVDEIEKMAHFVDRYGAKTEDPATQKV